MRIYRRLPRLDLPNATYFVSVTTAKMLPWFNEPALATALSRLIYAEREKSILLHAFVVMPDHYHLVATLLGDHRIPVVVGRINSLSAKQVNAYQGRVGSIWARRFYDHVIRNEDDFQECISYVHDNPRTAGFVLEAADFQFSSASYWEKGASHWGSFDSG
jgi:putative transposase